jgi:diguanylate cyclase (GGDEF)-like protein
VPVAASSEPETATEAQARVNAEIKSNQPERLNGQDSRAHAPHGELYQYADRLRDLAWLDLEESEAEALLRDAERHRKLLERRLGRDVGQPVALLDFLLNVRHHVVEPQIIDRSVLETLEYRAIVDQVTGLYNRHYFETELTHEVERCRRYGGWLSLLLLDLDRFKGINDQYGHALGDRLLHRVGELVRLHVRAVDIPCRYGGDELAVILPDAPPADALYVAERIRTAVESVLAQERFADHVLAVTVSGGISTFASDAAAVDPLIQAADEALYQAKGSGGNRVVEAPIGPIHR